MSCPYYSNGFCSNPNCWFILNGGCSWSLSYMEVRTTDNTAPEPSRSAAPRSDAPQCVCGHGIWEHEDWDFNIHECTHTGCECQQFKDADED